MEDLCGYRFSRHLLQFRGTHQRTFNRWSPLAQSGAPLGGFQHDDRFKIHMVILIPEINIFIQCHHWLKLSTYVHTHLLPKFMRFFPIFLHADDACWSTSTLVAAAPSGLPFFTADWTEGCRWWHHWVYLSWRNLKSIGGLGSDQNMFFFSKTSI